jgi:FkbM family methyltransferase
VGRSRRTFVIKSTLKKIPFARTAYKQVREWHRHRHDEGRRLFTNYDVYRQALNRKGTGTVVLHTVDGLHLTVRQNLWDARIVREIFLEKPYVGHFTLPANPVVVDIGGYIGDFSIYAAKHLKARRVVVYEPTAENFEILLHNVNNNGYSDRITAVNKAVSDSHEVRLNVQIKESEEVHVSAYWYPEAKQRAVPSDTLAEVVETHRLEHIDLLKVDCEGGEYDIFPATPDHIFNRIHNIVFEYHRMDGYQQKLDRVLARLKAAGYDLRIDDDIVSASR